jgi:hypothetical protein
MTETLVDPVDDFLMHFGVKGMKWGVRRSRSEDKGSGGKKNPAKADTLIEKAKKHENISAAHAAEAKRLEKQHDELMAKGINSEAFKKAFGENAPLQNDASFNFRHGMNKAQALGQASNNIRILHNQFAASSNRHAKKAVKLRAKAASLQHGEIVDLDDMAELDREIELGDAFLAHFGVKGMKWGVRHHGGTTTGTPRAKGTPSEDSAHAAALSAQVKKGGTSTLSNNELATLVKRMQLETQYKDLDKKTVNEGQKIVKDVLVNVGKQQASSLISKGATAGADYLTKKILEKAGK